MGNVGERRESTKGRATPAGSGLREEYGKANQRVRVPVSREATLIQRSTPLAQDQWINTQYALTPRALAYA